MPPVLKFPLLFCWIYLSVASCNDSIQQEFEIQKTVRAKNGMVVSATAIASETGRQILRRGGNAVDAAVAVHFVLAVVFPEAGNIGGGGFMVIRLQDGSGYTLDFRETAPGKAKETMYQDEDGNVIRNSSLLGHLASGVPGSVDGMVTAHERFGRLDWEELLEPAISLAKKGFRLTERQASLLNTNQVNFRLVNTRSPDFLLKDRWRAGDILQQSDLAETLALIRDGKRSGFYKGITADNIINEMARGKGLISRADLDNYSSVWREPVTGFYKNHKIISMGPPSAGGIALIQMLKMAENFNIDSIHWHDHRYIHLLCEIEKRAYADRAAYLGDPDYFPVPVSDLTDSAYLAERIKDLDFYRISAGISSGIINVYEPGETTHYSVVDKDRNVVAVTTTLNDSYGSRVVVAGSGFFLNNEMDDFSIKPGFRNLFGLTGGKANAIKPGKRMLSSMTPSIIEKAGEPYFVLGSPGGSRIITTVFQVILNVINYDMTLPEAVSAPRFHHQGIPDTLYYEYPRISGAVMEALREMNYYLLPVESMGRVNAIMVDGGILTGAADPRGDDGAAGF